MLKITNPSNGEVIHEIETDSAHDIKKKYERALSALKVFKKKQQCSFEDCFSKRLEAIQEFANLLKQKRNELALTLTQETGKPIVQSKSEINGLQERIDFFIESVWEEIKPRLVRKKKSLEERISYEPLGVLVNISAWNYPYFVGGNVFIPAILTGNSVLYKPSEYASLTGSKINQLFSETSLPNGVFQTIYGGSDTGKELLDLPIDGVFFTGSYRTGSKIAQKMRDRMIPLQLELGGKDPAYVHHDVDIPYSAKSLAGGAFYNNGQSCCAVERIYVHERVYELFLERFKQTVQSYQVGDPTKKDTFIGPLTRSEQIGLIDDQIKDALGKGAQVVLGGKAIKRTGFFFEPTILTNVNHTMDVMQSESFGPIIGIQKVKDETEGAELMKDTMYGLTASVYSKSQNIAKDILNSINSGSVYWNTCDRVSPYLPWSGRKNSGIGSTLSQEGIRAFVKPKAWHWNTTVHLFLLPNHFLQP